MHPLRVWCGLQRQVSLAHIPLKIRTTQPLCLMKTAIAHDHRFFLTPLHGINVNFVWFQQDDATCHSNHARTDLLRQTFDGRLISRKMMSIGDHEVAL